MESVKQKISETLTSEAEQWLGCGMTYTLFECLKDRIDEMMESQPQNVSDDESTEEDDSEESDDSDIDVRNLSISTKAPKKEHLSKGRITPFVAISRRRNFI